LLICVKPRDDLLLAVALPRGACPHAVEHPAVAAETLQRLAALGLRNKPSW